MFARYLGPFVKPNRIHLVPGRGIPGARVLLLSMRRTMDLAASCALYEFEDVIGELTGADRVEPETLERIEAYRRMYKLARRLSGSPSMAKHLAPRFAGLVLEKDYDLFLPVFNNAYELFALNAIPGWRKRCRFAACYVSEIWLQHFPRYLIELLAQFDRVYLGSVSPVAEVARTSGRPCAYLPLATDALLFSPYPNPPPWTIDVCGIGRRSAVTHAALLAAARERGLFYYFDSVRTRGPEVVDSSRQITFSVLNHAEHRFLLANLLKRSRYYIANRARANEPDMTRGAEEISGRFFEGATAGTVIVGAAPQTETFREHFGWPDAVIPTPFDSPRIGDLIAELDADPDRLARIRRDNAANGLLRHDWVHRLGRIFADLGLAPTPAMNARAARLRALAAQIKGAAVNRPAAGR